MRSEAVKKEYGLLAAMLAMSLLFVMAFPGPVCAAEGEGTSEEGSTNVVVAKERLAVEGIVIAEGARYILRTNGTAVLRKQVGSSRRKMEIPDALAFAQRTYKVVSVGKGAFSSCKTIKSLHIGKYVRRIADKAFKGCKNLSLVCCGIRVARLGAQAFSDCPRLSRVSRFPRLKVIGNSSFLHCYSLKTFRCSSALLKTIEPNAFFGCKHLRKVVLSSTRLSKLGQWSFAKCPLLNTFRCRSSAITMAALKKAGVV